MRIKIVNELVDIPDWYTVDFNARDVHISIERYACVVKEDDKGRTSFWELESPEEIELAEWLTQTET